ncbi:hypothetical protein FUT69_07985 [Xylella taiwanensis]|nr:hypothetical protein [Xylella taiwanensis]MCD8456729.1 hypothetical protein [Xylella taiwanensis]MCD8461969.1 hypothetical protein [Xylella taiwanensis]MCD8464228.1 hypothetical protein [Xylella taiwanensis]MCD8465783.1 hypothetical protein [Xylella taiwanensis]MCD8466659.1 hypothetical protein [Xylella taiwanensis]
MSRWGGIMVTAWKYYRGSLQCKPQQSIRDFVAFQFNRDGSVIEIAANAEYFTETIALAQGRVVMSPGDNGQENQPK